MSGSIEGDYAKLKALAAGCSKLRASFRKVEVAARDEAVKQYQRGFAEGRSPAGAAWAPTGRRKKGGSILVDNGNLANPSASIRGSGEIVVRAGSYVGVFHQGGWQLGGTVKKVTVGMSIEKKAKVRRRKLKDGTIKTTTVFVRSRIRKKVRIGGHQVGPARPFLPAEGTAGKWETPIEKTMAFSMDRELARLLT